MRLLLLLYKSRKLTEKDNIVYCVVFECTLKLLYHQSSYIMKQENITCKDQAFYRDTIIIMNKI